MHWVSSVEARYLRAEKKQKKLGVRSAEGERRERERDLSRER